MIENLFFFFFVKVNLSLQSFLLLMKDSSLNIKIIYFLKKIKLIYIIKHSV